MSSIRNTTGARGRAPALIAGALAAGILGAFAGGPAAATEAHPLLGKGAATYKLFCTHCHGVDMVNPGTGSYDLRRYPTDRAAEFRDTVMNGKGDMPAWGDILLPDELDALWVYVATRGGKQAFPEKAAAAPTAPEAAPELAAAGTLTVCLAKNGGALSGWRAKGGAGLDYRVSAALAERLGLDLDVTWFETEQEEESDPVRETYALLALGLCDLAPAHPLYEGAMGPPPTPVASPPRWDDKPAHWGRKQAHLAPVSVSRPYMRAEIGLVLGPAAPEGAGARGFDGLEGLRLGIQQGTLAGALAREQAPASVTAAMTTMPPGPSFLWLMETGAFDVAAVDVAAWDFHKRQNPVTLMRLADWRHPLGFNIGVATLSRNEALLAQVDAAIEAMLAEGEVARLAAADGVTYAPPREPWVQPRLTRADLSAVD